MPTVAEQQAKLVDLQTKAQPFLTNQIGPTEMKAAGELTAEIREVKTWLELNNVVAQTGINHGIKAMDLGTIPDTSVQIQDGKVIDPGSAIPVRAQKAIQDPAYKSAYRSWVASKGNTDNMDAADRKTLQEGVDGEGGFFVPAEIQDFVIMKKPAPTSLLGKVRQFNISKDSTVLPKLLHPSDNLYTSPVDMVNAGELPGVGAITQPTPPFGQAEIKMYTYMGSLPLSLDLVDDATVDLQSLIGELLSQASFQRKERAITIGTGNNEALGILTLAGGSIGNLNQIPTFPASLAATNFADVIKALPSQIPPQYDGGNYAYAFNKQNTYSFISTLKDAQKRYLFGMGYQDSGISAGKPTELAGEPFVFAQYMPNAATQNIGGAQLTNGAIPIMFGDWTGYFLVNRMGFSTKILDQTLYKQNQLEIVSKMRFGGQPAEEWKFAGINLAA